MATNDSNDNNNNNSNNNNNNDNNTNTKTSSSNNNNNNSTSVRLVNDQIGRGSICSTGPTDVVCGRPSAKTRCLLSASYWFKLLLSELLGAGKESQESNRSRAPSGPLRPWSRQELPLAMVTVTHNVSADWPSIARP